MDPSDSSGSIDGGVVGVIGVNSVNAFGAGDDFRVYDPVPDIQESDFASRFDQGVFQAAVGDDFFDLPAGEDFRIKNIIADIQFIKDIVGFYDRRLRGYSTYTH